MAQLPLRRNTVPQSQEPLHGHEFVNAAYGDSVGLQKTFLYRLALMPSENGIAKKKPISRTKPWLQGTSSKLPRPLFLYAFLILFFWLLSVLPLIIRSTHLWSAATLWIVPPFYDFGCYYQQLRYLHTPQFWTYTSTSWDYPAPCILVYQLFYAFNRGTGGPHPVFFGFLAYLIFVAGVLAIAGIALGRAVHRRGIAWPSIAPFLGISLLLCWPLFFGMERGNIEFFLDAGIALGIYAYIERKWWLAAIILGLFGAGKLYPLLFLSLFLPARRWKEFAAGLCTAIAITAFSSHWIGPAPPNSQQPVGVTHVLLNWIHANALNIDLRTIGYDHSIFGTIKEIGHNHPEWFAPMAIAYACIGSVLMLVLFFTKLWKMPRPNQLLAVTIAALLLPPTSFDYTLDLLLPAWAWIMLETTKTPVSLSNRKAHLLLFAGFAFLFAPEAFLTWHGLLISGQFKMCCLVLMFLFALTVSLPENNGTPVLA
jgi:hypothetical protein